MKSAEEIGKRVARAKDELQAITNPVAKRTDGGTYRGSGKEMTFYPDPTSNDAVKAENEKKVIALTAEINALCWAQEGPFTAIDLAKQPQVQLAEPGDQGEPLPKGE